LFDWRKAAQTRSLLEEAKPRSADRQVQAAADQQHAVTDRFGLKTLGWESPEQFAIRFD